MKSYWLILAFFLLVFACSSKEEAAPPVTAQVVKEVANESNRTVQPPIERVEPPKDPFKELQDEQKGLYQELMKVRNRIRELTRDLKTSTKKEELQKELTKAHHKRDDLQNKIEVLDKQIQALRTSRRAQEEEKEIQQVIGKLYGEEKELKEKIKDNQFRIDKVREAIQQISDKQVQEDLKVQLEELYSDQQVLDARLEKVFKRIAEQEANLRELDHEVVEKTKESLQEQERTLLLANIEEIERLIKEKEKALSSARDEAAKKKLKKLLSELNDLARQKSNLRDALEAMED